MKKLSFLFLSVFLLLNLGCSYKTIKHGEQISTQDASTKLLLGQTTKNEVFLSFGEPTKTANNEQVFFYSWTRGSKVAVFGIGSGNAEGSSLVIIFDNDDVVKDYKITRGAVESGQVD